MEDSVKLLHRVPVMNENLIILKMMSEQLPNQEQHHDLSQTLSAEVKYLLKN
jgi:hypothetical protein